MHFWRGLVFAVALLFTTGCQFSYLAHSGYHQAKLMASREPIEKILASSKTPEETKRKLRLVQEAMEFARHEMHLKTHGNYRAYVALEDPYVSYVVQVAYAYELKSHKWNFPLVGSLPYKGYFVKAMAEDEARKFAPEQFDTYVRGVSAFSTLGWLRDPIYSSMLRYTDHDLVETVIHETVHANLYIKSNADFNERLATFIGQEGVKAFYLKKEGESSATLKKIQQELKDQQLFSQFISKEIDELKNWYTREASGMSPEKKKARLKSLQDKFVKEVQPKFQSASYKNFATQELNNAILLSYKTYLYDLSDFARLFTLKQNNFAQLIEYCQSLEGEKDPEGALKSYLSSVH